MIHKLYNDVLKTIVASQTPATKAGASGDQEGDLAKINVDDEPAPDFAGTMRRRVDEAEEVMKS